MISYNPFWTTLHASKDSTYTLIKNHRISSSTIDKLCSSKPLNTTTINDICRILNCRVEDIMEYVPSEDDLIFKGRRPKKGGGLCTRVAWALPRHCTNFTAYEKSASGLQRYTHTRRCLSGWHKRRRNTVPPGRRYGHRCPR